MTAHEQQHERVVFLRPDVRIGRRHDLVIVRLLQHDDGLAPAAGGFGADVIGHPAGCNMDQPATRVLGHALVRPLRRCGDQRLLHSIFGGGEVAKAADDGTEHLRRQFTKHGIDAEGFSHQRINPLTQ